MLQKKVCMIGAFGVGKTSLVARFVHSIFSERYHTTIGVKIDKKPLVVGGREITLMLWDLAGEDDLTEVNLAQLRGASAYILVADGCRASTIDVARDLQKRVAEALGDVPFMCVINKLDLAETWEIDQARQDELLAGGWPLLCTSAKSGEGVEELFISLAREILREDHVRATGTGARA
jgi:small GTP-binding protein